MTGAEEHPVRSRGHRGTASRRDARSRVVALNQIQAHQRRHRGHQTGGDDEAQSVSPGGVDDEQQCEAGRDDAAQVPSQDDGVEIVGGIHRPVDDLRLEERGGGRRGQDGQPQAALVVPPPRRPGTDDQGSPQKENAIAADLVGEVSDGHRSGPPGTRQAGPGSRREWVVSRCCASGWPASPPLALRRSCSWCGPSDV